jgi:hypothetical protein
MAYLVGFNYWRHSGVSGFGRAFMQCLKPVTRADVEAWENDIAYQLGYETVFVNSFQPLAASEDRP